MAARRDSHTVLIAARPPHKMVDTMTWRSLVQSKHFPFLAAGIAVPVLASLLVVVDSERIAFRFLPQFVLPQTCFSRAFFSFNCPACGLTRSIIFLVQGRFWDSLAMHRLGWFMFLLIVAQVPYRLWRLTGRGPQLIVASGADRYYWVGLAVLFVLNRAWDFVTLL